MGTGRRQKEWEVYSVNECRQCRERIWRAAGTVVVGTINKETEYWWKKVWNEQEWNGQNVGSTVS